MPPFIADIAFSALWAASAVGFYLFCIRPQLARRRARPAAFLVPGMAAAAVLVLLVAQAFLAVPPILFVAPTVILVALWMSPDELIGLMGGPRPLAPSIDAAFAQSSQAWARLQVGDVDGASEAVEELERIRTTGTDRYVGLWSRFMAEERARRSGTRASSESTLLAIREEASRLRTLDVRLGPRQSWAAVGLAMVVGMSPALFAARACIGVELLLPAGAIEASGDLPLLANAHVPLPEPGAELVLERPLTLEAAAESRHDPATYDQLVDAGYLAGWVRIWRMPNGDQIESGVFEFSDRAGALQYHEQVNRHACQFSNEAFAGPDSGIGLQVRYGSGPHPIVEQVSWVIGPRRHVVSVGTTEAPPDHARILQLAEQAIEDAGG